MENPRPISNNWRLFWLLLGAGLFGSACVVPYALALIGDKVPKLPLPLPAVLALQTVQALLLLALFVGVGLLLAPKVGLGAPYLERWVNGGTGGVSRTAVREIGGRRCRRRISDCYSCGIRLLAAASACSFRFGDSDADMEEISRLLLWRHQ